MSGHDRYRVALVIAVCRECRLTQRIVPRLPPTPLQQRSSSATSEGESWAPEAALDAVKDSAHPHTTCSFVSPRWKREDNVLSHPPTLTTLYLCLFVSCSTQFTKKRKKRGPAWLSAQKNGPYNDNHNEHHQHR